MHINEKKRLICLVSLIAFALSIFGMVPAMAAQDNIEILFTDVTRDNETTLLGEAKIKVSVRGAGGDVTAVQTALKFTGDLKYKSIDFLQGENNPPKCFFIPPNAALVNSTGKLLPSITATEEGKLTFTDEVTDLFIITFTGEPGDSVTLSLNDDSAAGTYCAVGGSYISASKDASPSASASASSEDNEGINAVVKVVMDKVDNFQLATAEGYADSKITLSITNEVTGSTISTVLNTIADIKGGHFDTTVSIPTFVVENTVIASHTYTVELKGSGYVDYKQTGVTFSETLTITNDDFVPGDINSDGVVDSEDKKAFENAKNGEYNEFADFNRSGTVDERDNVFSHIEDIPEMTVPGQVSNLSFSVSTNQITVSWTKPADGGSPITGYIVKYGTKENNLDKTLSVNDGTALQATITGLNSNSTYYVSVAAINAIGTGGISRVASTSTSAAVSDDSSGGGGGGNGGGGSSGGGGGSGGGGFSPSSPSLIPSTVPAGQFSDLAGYEWAKDSIYKLKSKNIINGVTATEFAPANNIRRADFILILVRMMGIEGEVTSNFADVSPDSYYYDAVGKAKAAGVATGDGVNFMPEASITRQDLITLAYRAFVSAGYISDSVDYSALDSFSDSAEISEYARSAMASMVGEGIIKGSDGKVNPLGNATRAEVAVMCARLNELIK